MIKHEDDDPCLFFSYSEEQYTYIHSFIHESEKKINDGQGISYVKIVEVFDLFELIVWSKHQSATMKETIRNESEKSMFNLIFKKMYQASVWWNHFFSIIQS